MARILVSGPRTVAASDAMQRLRAQLHEDGHEAKELTGDLIDSLRTSDAVIALLDGPADAATGAVLASARAQHKPVLGLHGADAPPALVREFLTVQQEGASTDEWLAALPAFYERIRPFAGRLVRDLIPQLVQEAGHDVAFRALADDEKPRFLKEKILDEARQLRDADPGAEKEELADILESLEALIRARGHDREALRQVKDGKKKRRGGFERCWVVEETA